MLTAPPALRPSQPLLQDSDLLRAIADTLLPHSRELIARGKARAEARACAAVMYEASLAREVEEQRRRVQLCESHAEQGDPSCDAEQPIQPPTPAHSSVLPRLDQILPNCVVKLKPLILLICFVTTATICCCPNVMEQQDITV